MAETTDETETSREPTTPRPAASVMLLRNGEAGGAARLEVLMLRRSESAGVMPGVWVFPGGSVDPEDGEGEEGHRACALRELAEEAAIELPAGTELILFNRWITPEIFPVRFDAWFFLAPAPAEALPQPDGVETTEAAWLPPGKALEAHADGAMAMVFPTLKQLEWLSAYGSSEEAIAANRDRVVEPTLPKPVGGERPRLALPGEPDYPA